MMKYTVKWLINNEMMKWTKKWWNEQWNDEILKGLSKSVNHTKWPRALAYDKWTMKWWNEQRNDEMNKEMMKP